MTDPMQLADAIDPKVAGFQIHRIGGEAFATMKCADLIAASDALRTMAWRPIETAPKDGTWIITWSPCAKDHNIREIRMNYFAEGGWQHTNEGWWPAEMWMPLPTPPAGEMKDE
jgi:hypothetical protein